jgi:hypothetical protein
MPAMWMKMKLSATLHAARRDLNRQALPAQRHRREQLWSKEFLKAGKRRLAGDAARAATIDEVKQLRREAQDGGRMRVIKKIK